MLFHHLLVLVLRSCYIRSETWIEVLRILLHLLLQCLLSELLNLLLRFLQYVKLPLLQRPHVLCHILIPLSLPLLGFRLLLIRPSLYLTQFLSMLLDEMLLVIHLSTI